MATLAQLAQQYLNQGLPSISGIFQPRANAPVEEPVEETIPGITPQLLQPMGGGGGFNPYNINPNDPNVRTSKNYSPYNMRQAYASTYRGPNDPGVGIPSGILSDSSFLYGEPTGIGKTLGTAANFIPGIGGLKKGVEFLSGIMPVNRRGILENELLSGGIMLDDIGRIVTNNYNTPEGIMAGYNAAKLTDKSFDKRTGNISKALREKGLSQSQIDAVIAEIEETGEYTGEITDESLGVNNLFSNLVNVNKAKNLFRKKQNIADLITKNKETKKGIPEQNIAVSRRNDATRNDGSIGGGSYDRSRDYSGASDKTAGDRSRTRDARSSDLGFSDIRLKENVELIGKSPSNINIYKFNYKDNPTTYQGAMAHEVPWASVKHSNGYMMIDYNEIDVEFKKWQR
jgi:hypothetical protein